MMVKRTNCLFSGSLLLYLLTILYYEIYKESIEYYEIYKIIIGRYMEFTEKILKAMEEKKVTAYEICKNLNISQTTFSSWKKGSKPSIDKAIDIIRYLQLSADEIFDLKEKEPDELTEEEKKIIEAYRGAAPAIQIATKKLLDIAEPEPEKLSTSRTG